MKAKLKTRLLACAVSVGWAFGSAAPAVSYGGEDFIDGNPWHHHDMTVRALMGDARAYSGVDGVRSRATPIMAGVGFDKGAAHNVAWYADYIDSYLYNPLFWAKGGANKSRMKASLAHFDSLVKMHHDDTFTTAGVEDNWERYMSGALAGLDWAATNGDVRSAHLIMGMTLHSVQDFYTHSNWMDDPARRMKTWHETTPAERRNMRLYTGIYEEPESAFSHHHGDYGFQCGAINAPGVTQSLSLVCEGNSPMSASGLCVQRRECSDAKSVPVAIMGADMRNSKYGPLYASPTGINIDSVRLARIGTVKRGIVDRDNKFRTGQESWHMMTDPVCDAIVNYGISCTNGPLGNKVESCEFNSRFQSDGCGGDPADNDAAISDHIFAQSKLLAMRSTQQVVAIFGEHLSKRHPAFWNRVKSQPSFLRDTEKERARAVEDFSKAYFQFMAAGPYPVANPGSAPNSDGWYVRTRITTADKLNAGTDSDIYAEVVYKHGNGTRSQRFLLDYLPDWDAQGKTTNPLLIFNDFERGDKTIYTVGPVKGEPVSIRLFNDSASAGDLTDAALDSVKKSITDVKDSLVDIATFIVGDDLVGTKVTNYTADDLINPRFTSLKKGIVIDNSTEGKYELKMTVKDVSRTSDKQAGERRIQIQLDSLKCHRESNVDQGSNSDEPYIMFIATPIMQSGQPQRRGSYYAGPYSDIDSGDQKTFTSAVSKRRFEFILGEYDTITLATQIWEWDNNTKKQRDDKWKKFADGLDKHERESHRSFISHLATVVANEWEVSDVRAVAFKRGPKPMVKAQARGMLSGRTGLIDGGEKREFSFGSARAVSVTGNNISVGSWTVDNQISGFDGLVRDPYGESREAAAKAAADILNAATGFGRNQSTPILIENSGIKVQDSNSVLQPSTQDLVIQPGTVMKKAEEKDATPQLNPPAVILTPQQPVRIQAPIAIQVQKPKSDEASETATDD